VRRKAYRLAAYLSREHPAGLAARRRGGGWRLRERGLRRRLAAAAAAAFGGAHRHRGGCIAATFRTLGMAS